MPVAEALARVLDGVRSSDPESVRLTDVLGRTLAAPLKAKLTQPPFDASAMDGYAVRAADIAELPATLTLIGVAAAGRAYAGTLQAGQAVRIFTGAPVPDGTDAIVIQEDSRAEADQVTILAPATPGGNIRPMGQDFLAGDTLLAPGLRLSARHILLAAASGHAMLSVRKKPTVALLANGDELVEPGTPLGPGQIVSSNTYGLAALIEAAGGTPLLLGIARDTREDLAAKIATAKDADILVTIGGASVGDHDLVRPALEASGATLDFTKIAMRPGKPMFSGRLGVTRILGLPGNPVSALVTARVFLVPLIAALLGRDDTGTTIDAILSQPLPANGPRDHYMRASLDTSSVPPRVTPLPSQDSSLVSALAAAGCLIIVPANAPAHAEGARVSVLPLDF